MILNHTDCLNSHEYFYFVLSHTVVRLGIGALHGSLPESHLSQKLTVFLDFLYSASPSNIPHIRPLYTRFKHVPYIFVITCP